MFRAALLCGVSFGFVSLCVTYVCSVLLCFVSCCSAFLCVVLLLFLRFFLLVCLALRCAALLCGALLWSVLLRFVFRGALDPLRCFVFVGLWIWRATPFQILSLWQAAMQSHFASRNRAASLDILGLQVWSAAQFWNIGFCNIGTMDSCKGIKQNTSVSYDC